MNNKPTFDHLLSCAVSVARRAGSHALDNIARRTEVFKTFSHDVKLNLDLECQKIAEDIVIEHFPNHRILGEETESISQSQKNNIKNHDSPYEWIIDPIDGTVNFSHGLQLWCCSVAVRKNNSILAGAVFAPELDVIYTATADGPAYCNDEALTISQNTRLSDSIILTGTNEVFSDGQRPFALFEEIASKSQKARILGSAALDICNVAAGRADGYFESSIYIWDIAAAGLIAERAGGRIEQLTTPDKNHNMSFMATNGHIHEELKQVINL
ncbi:MAG: inositol monophosphatase [Kiritimatiellae bacterium]|nr:inositol monophosphatase [Kiritimatiellia bacterium]